MSHTKKLSRLTNQENFSSLYKTLCNENLIRAAPEMLEALENAKQRLELAGLNDTTLDIVKSAIKKAKGE